MGESSRLVASLLCGLALAACTSHSPNDAISKSSTPAGTITTTAAYDGAAYVKQVEGVLRDSFGLSSLAEACPQPNWVCAIDTMESGRRGDLEVTLKPEWEQIFGEWTGPPAGIGCLKWGERLSRNLENFIGASDVEPPTHIAVREPNGRNC